MLQDSEFGTITLRKVRGARSVKFSIAPNGTLRVSMPSMTPQFIVKRMIERSRPELRKLFETRAERKLADGMAIGKRHVLLVRQGSTFSLKRSGQHLVLTLGQKDSLGDKLIVSHVREQSIRILRKEAKEHLPNRIQYIANMYGFEYSKLRFSHASTRWGSCNSNKVISLNIALMNLPLELIDYVLVHELAHTVYLNHSAQFWSEVERADPDYKAHRKLLKAHDPGV